jgi:hypothetical protein
MTAFEAWALQAGQIGNATFHPTEPIVTVAADGGFGGILRPMASAENSYSGLNASAP